jgi:hypothetical protein
MSVSLAAALTALAGCGYKLGNRHFAGPVLPLDRQNPGFVVGDDRSVTFQLDRLEIILLPVTDEALNRQFAAASSAGEGYRIPSHSAVNPYTYGDWTPPESSEPPQRFTVFNLKVKNYSFPKVRIQPARIYLTSTNGRRYNALSLLALQEFYWPYALGYSGRVYRDFLTREDLLRKTLFRGDVVFSGQEVDGFVVFELLENDVEEFAVHLRDVVLRFDYKNEPLETIDVAYRFQRQITYAREPLSGE